jgi:hypothetical protein
MPNLRKIQLMKHRPDHMLVAHAKLPAPSSKFAEERIRLATASLSKGRRGGLRASRESGLIVPRLLLAFTICSVGVFLAALGFAANPTTPGWALVTSPNAGATPTFSGVACSSASDCWAIGGHYAGANGASLETFIEHWNGAAWSIVASPNPGGPPVLNGVACSSASQCWAVGYYQFTYYDAYGHATVVVDQTLIEKWDGTSWTVVTSPNSGTSSFLTGVTCASASQCWAVGYYNNGSMTQTLTEEWNGTAWVIIPSANQGTNQPNFLDGVTCTSASNCWAVGYYNNGGVTQTLTERWDGTLWTVVNSPNTSSSQNNQLAGVTCASASDCWAAGKFNNGSVDQTLIEHWNGTSWAMVGSPSTSSFQNNQLNAVVCGAQSECWSVGKSNSGFVDQTLVERWNGTSWVIANSPDTIGGGSLNSVTCASASECWSVGRSNNGSVDPSLIAHWNGTSWAVVNSPNALTPWSTQLQDVACASASECWAIGYSGALDPLIERWNGNSWAIVASPTPYGGFLQGVTCASTSECWAVGYYYNGSTLQTFIERWDGSAWSVVPSSNIGTTRNVLSSVTCTSASDCWAVGYYNSGSIDQTLIERWNGTSWSVVNSANPPFDAASLNGVACASPSQCWAIGTVSGEAGSAPIAERWDGTSWILATLPYVGGDFLASVTCASASECWAVGSSASGVETSATLIEKWDGTAWAVASSPNLGDSSSLRDVTCGSASNCWAVGVYSNGAIDLPFTVRWDGTSWSIVSSPAATSNGQNEINGVACASASQCWTVGYYVGGPGTQTLIEEFSPTVPPLTSVASRKTHGGAGTFDITLPLTGTRGVECRSPGATGTPGVDYKLVFSFVNNLTGCGTASTGSLSSGPGSNQCTVSLTGVPNQQYISVTLNNVLDSQNNTGNVAATMGVLIGDVNGDGRVNVGDTNQTKSLSGATLDQSSGNFRADVNVDGRINVGDTNFVKANSGSSLP